MKKNIVLSLSALLIAGSAFASGSPEVTCKVNREDLTITVQLDQNEGGPEYPVYYSATSGVNLSSKNDDLADLDGTASGYYKFEDNKGNPLPQVLKIRFKSKDGSIINIDATAPAASKTKVPSMTGKATIILREKNAPKLKSIEDLRSVDVTCDEDWG